MTSLVYTRRIERLLSLTEEEKLNGVIVENSSDLFYFTGYRGAGYLVVSKEKAILTVPILEYLHALDYVREEGLGDIIDVAVFRPYGLPGQLVVEDENVRLVDNGLKGLVASMLGQDARCGLVSNSLSFYNQLDKLCTEVKVINEKIMKMRMVKEAWEIERIENAARIAEAALQAALEALSYSISEAEIAGIIEATIRAEGGDGPSFPPIVAFGKNTIYPHAFPSRERVLVKPSPVLIDLGAVYKGYCSDMTRTMFFDGSPAEFRHVAEAVHEALTAAYEKAGPGVTTSELDTTARGVLEKYGLSRYFIHSLGHGIGIDIHEPPRVTYSDKTTLEPGMVITIEPGVYIPNRLGVRIEELVLITNTGAKKLTRIESWLWQ